MKNYFILVSLLVVMTSGGVWFSQHRTKEETVKDHVTIGALIPLSGAFANIGEDIKNAMELARKDLEVQYNLVIDIKYEDSGAEPKKAVSAARKLIGTDKTPVIIGGPGSSANLAAAPVMEAGRTVFIPLSSTPKLNEAGEYIFKAHPDFDGEINRMVQLAYTQGLRQFGIIFDNASDTQTTGKDLFVRKFNELGGSVIAEGADNASPDFRSQLVKLKQANPDGLYFLVNDMVAGRVVKQAREIGFSQPIFGTTGYETGGFLQTAGQASEGVIITAQPFSCEGTSAMRRFCEQYRAVYQRTPTHYGAYAYDLMAIILERNKSTAFTAEHIRDSLLNSRYRGITGDLNFDTQGNIRDKDFVFRIVKDGKFVNLDQ